MDYYGIGQRIAEARIKNNKTQEELAEELDITPAFLSNIETAKRKPSLNKFLEIADKLNMSLDYLIYNKNVQKEMDEDIVMKQIYKQLEKLDDSKKEKFLNIIDYIAKNI